MTARRRTGMRERWLPHQTSKRANYERYLAIRAECRATRPRGDLMTEPGEILESLAREGVTIWAEGSRIRFRAAKGGFTNELKARLTENKTAVLAAWRERAAKHVTSHPATHAQRALWFLFQESPESASYNVVLAARIRSEIDISALQHA